MNDQGQIEGAPSIGGHILTPGEYAIYGAVLGNVGYSEDRVAQMMGKMERRAAQMGMQMATTLMTEFSAEMAGTVQAVHVNACNEIYRQLSDQTMGFGGVTHRKCCNIAIAVGNGRPLHAAVPARPRLGTPH